MTNDPAPARDLLLHGGAAAGPPGGGGAVNVTELRADDRDADALMFAAEADHLAFAHGIYVDADGRRAVTLLVSKNYPRTVAMRLAIQRERATW